MSQRNQTTEAKQRQAAASWAHKGASPQILPPSSRQTLNFLRPCCCLHSFTHFKQLLLLVIHVSVVWTFFLLFSLILNIVLWFLKIKKNNLRLADSFGLEKAIFDNRVYVVLFLLLDSVIFLLVLFMVLYFFLFVFAAFTAECLHCGSTNISILF